MKARFLVNARPSTLGSGFLDDARAGGYLFPPDAASRPVVEALRATRRFVLSDNGAFELIGQLTRDVGRPPDLAALGRRAAGSAVMQQLPEQMAVRPQAVIGPENLTVAVWLRAGADEATLRGRRSAIRRRNEQVAQRAAELASRLPGVRVLGVASAHDHDSAADAGRAFAAAGLRDAAMGFGAFMADDSWAADVKVGGRTRPLPRALPTRYVRTAAIAAGFFATWGSVGRHFHFLGLGAPVMLPLVVLAGRDVELLTFDATSPIKDAVDGTWYVEKPAALKVRTWRVAERVLRGGATWDCPCPFCRRFLAVRPLDLSRARAVQGDAPVTVADLAPAGRLSEPLSLFAVGRRPSEEARMGHNHWVLGRLTAELSTTDSSRLAAVVQRRVGAYVDHAGAAPYSDAVRLGHQLVTRTL